MDKNIVRKIERVARRVFSSKNVHLNKIDAYGTHILGELLCAADDVNQVSEYEFPAVEKEFQKYFDVFKGASKSVCVKTGPVVYFSSDKGAFYTTFDFDARKDALFSNEERIEEIKKLIDDVQ